MRYSAYVSPFCSLIVSSNAFNEAATMSPVKMMPRKPIPIAISFDRPDSGVRSPYPNQIGKNHHSLAQPKTPLTCYLVFVLACPSLGQ
jgi:hypothetical protein